MFIATRTHLAHVTVDGPPGAPVLLLLHSLGTSSAIWDAQARALSTSLRVVRADLRGHGLSEVTPGPYTIEQLGGDALAVLDALGVRAAHVGGASLGGMVAQAVAHAAPERVLSLVLSGTALAIPPASRWRDRAALVRERGVEVIADDVVARWVTPAYRGSPEARGLRAILTRTAPEGYAASAEAIAAADLTLATRRLRVPALVLVGDRDEATPPSSAEALRDAIPGARYVVIQNAAHIAPVERADDVTSAMRSFLSSLLDRGDAARAGGGNESAYDAGMAARTEVLGEAYVAGRRAAESGLDRDFQRFITETAWGRVWARPHFDRRTRSIVTVALLAALGREHELALHLRACRNTGATPEDIAELLLHVAVYAGVPAANHAMRIAKDVLENHDEERDRSETR